MAVLDATNRTRIGNHFMRTVAGLAAPLTGLLKADLRAAVDATDTWIDSNQTSFNTALPVAARNALTLPQKTLLFCFVAMRRAGVLQVQEDN